VTNLLTNLLGHFVKAASLTSERFANDVAIELPGQSIELRITQLQNVLRVTQSIETGGRVKVRNSHPELKLQGNVTDFKFY
jgi:hypothetical protein